MTVAADFGRYWLLDPEVAFLNHGSFGACPLPVLDVQRELRARMERQPVQFFARDLEGLLDDARGELADFLGARACDLVWVPNATTAVNAVLRSFPLEPHDELLVTDHEYDACRNALDFVAQRAGARVVVVSIPFPIESADRAVDAVLSAVTPRTRLALLDHVTSQTALVMPVERWVAGLAERGVECLVDGAHAPGMLPLDVEAIGADYYTGNCHKWLCAPKGAGFLHVRARHQSRVRPVVISHGAGSRRSDRSRFRVEFDWVGTDDPTPMLCVPAALRFMGSLLPGGWPELRRHNHELAVAARDVVCRALDVPRPCPDAMLGSMASIPLPAGSSEPPSSPLYADPLQAELLRQRHIEVPVIPWPAPGRRLLRVSAQLYNRPGQYVALGEALRERFGGP